MSCARYDLALASLTEGAGPALSTFASVPTSSGSLPTNLLPANLTALPTNLLDEIRGLGQRSPPAQVQTAYLYSAGKSPSPRSGLSDKKTGGDELITQPCIPRDVVLSSRIEEHQTARQVRRDISIAGDALCVMYDTQPDLWIMKCGFVIHNTGRST
jgi:hypothetical protein